MHLLFIYGSAAAGKLTIARHVAQRAHLPLFHNHLVVDALLAIFPFGSDEFVTLREHFWLETFQAAARSGRSLIFTFCPEPTVDQAFPEKVRKLVQDGRGTVSFIRLNVSAEEQERRLIAPSRGGGKLRRIEVLRALRSGFDESMAAMPSPDLAIDTELLNPSESADQIVKLVQRVGAGR